MPTRNVLALDVGEHRVGVAIARASLRVPVALPTLERNNPDFWEQLATLIKENEIETVVVGLPRGAQGQVTAQTATVQVFGQELTEKISVTLVWQDESLTSVEAEKQLRETHQPYNKADIDARAACLILADYIETVPQA